jgi:hypothetical protein
MVDELYVFTTFMAQMPPKCTKKSKNVQKCPKMSKTPAVPEKVG